jgi:hypothetical protein
MVKERICQINKKRYMLSGKDAQLVYSIPGRSVRNKSRGFRELNIRALKQRKRQEHT